MNATADHTLPGRARAARWVLIGAGLLSLVSYLFLPFLDASSLYRAVIAPGYGLPVQLDSSVVGHAEGERAEILDALHSEAMLAEVGDPLPPAAEDGYNLTVSETFGVGDRLVDHAPTLGEFAVETRIVGKFLLVATGLYLVVAIFCTAVPLLRGPESVLSNVLSGASALLLLATHLLTVGLDLSGVIEGGLFTWQNHVVTVLIVILGAVGTGLPLGPTTALKVALGTLGLFIVSAVSIGLYTVA